MKEDSKAAGEPKYRYKSITLTEEEMLILDDSQKWFKPETVLRWHHELVRRAIIIPPLATHLFALAEVIAPLYPSYSPNPRLRSRVSSRTSQMARHFFF